MRKYAICPICKAQIQVEYPNQAPRPILESHLHYREGQTWVHARHIARSSTVILEDDNGNEIYRDKGRPSGTRNTFGHLGPTNKAQGASRDGGSPRRPAFELKRPKRKAEIYS